MNQGFKRFLPVIFSGVAVFCALLNFIFVIVLEGGAWDYVDSIFVFLAIIALLVFTIIQLVNPNIHKAVFIAPLAIMAANLLILGIHYLIEMGSVHYEYSKAAYFTAFVKELLSIGIMVLFVLSIVKKNRIFAAVSLTYLAVPFFLNGLTAFNNSFFALFTDIKFKYGFSDFMGTSSSFLFYVTFAALAYNFFSRENR